MENRLREKFLYEERHKKSRCTGHPSKEDDLIIKDKIAYDKGKTLVFDEY